MEEMDLHQVPEAIKDLEKKVMQGNELSKEEANFIASIPDDKIFALIASANNLRNYFRKNNVSLCSIINAKSGLCSEDCAFCAQSSKSKAKIEIYPLLNKATIIEKASELYRSGAKRFSIVTSGRSLSPKNLSEIAGIIPDIKKIGLVPCASLGFLSEENLKSLKKAGLERYHHNIETSEAFFKKICTTHSYKDKLETIHAAFSAGLSVCSGGIFGMGETWADRIDMAFTLKYLNVDSIPLNFLIPIKGTPLGERKLLHPFEALKIISLYRFILPEKEIRVCGGRLQVLSEFNSLVFAAGADGIITGNYLTTPGKKPDEDLNLVHLYGLSLS
jgi:biotin synthase